MRTYGQTEERKWRIQWTFSATCENAHEKRRSPCPSHEGMCGGAEVQLLPFLMSAFEKANTKCFRSDSRFGCIRVTLFIALFQYFSCFISYHYTGYTQKMVQFQQLTRNLFLTLQGHNAHRQQRQMSKFLMRYQQFASHAYCGAAG
jgi:hypothetical protein